MLGDLLHDTTREERLLLAWLLRAISVWYKHLPSSAMHSVNSHAQGAEKYSRLVDRKNASTQTWSEDEEGVGVYLCACVQAYREEREEHFSPVRLSWVSVQCETGVSSPSQDLEIRFG